MHPLCRYQDRGRIKREARRLLSAEPYVLAWLNRLVTVSRLISQTLNQANDLEKTQTNARVSGKAVRSPLRRSSVRRERFAKFLHRVSSRTYTCHRLWWATGAATEFATTNFFTHWRSAVWHTRSSRSSQYNQNKQVPSPSLRCAGAPHIRRRTAKSSNAKKMATTNLLAAATPA